MKFLASTLLATILISPVVLAEDFKQDSSYTTTPLNVAFAGYRGELRSQGIPGYQSFCDQLRWGQLSPKSVAVAAADAGLLTDEEAKDTNFIGYLRFQLISICHF